MVVESAGKAVDDVVVAAVRSWKFEPATKRGIRVKVEMSFTQTFLGGVRAVAKLIVNPTSSNRREIPLSRTTILTIGRDPSNDLVLPDAMVSRRHAVIEHRGSQFFLRDCSSANGSVVNGDRVSERGLRDGDLVAIGSMRLLFREELLESGRRQGRGAPLGGAARLPRLQVADYRRGDLFCRECGAQVAQPSGPPKAVCAACGAAVPLPARFCNACGGDAGAGRPARRGAARRARGAATPATRSRVPIAPQPSRPAPRERRGWRWPPRRQRSAARLAPDAAPRQPASDAEPRPERSGAPRARRAPSGPLARPSPSRPSRAAAWRPSWWTRCSSLSGQAVLLAPRRLVLVGARGPAHAVATWRCLPVVASVVARCRSRCCWARSTTSTSGA